MHAYKIVLFLCFIISSTLFSQTKDVSKLNAEQKKQELIETIEWLQSKTGKDFYYGCYDHFKKIYNTITYNSSNPSLIKISQYDYDTDILIKEYLFNLEDIYSPLFGTDGRCKFTGLTTYENQRLINLTDEGKDYLTNLLYIYYDNSVKYERIENALIYAIKLSDGGQEILKEKF